MLAVAAAGAMQAAAAPFGPRVFNPPPQGYYQLGIFSGIGSRQADLVGPGPAGQLFYLSYVYAPSGDFDLVAIDPDTGLDTVIPGPVLAGTGPEYRANLVIGNDGQIYIGTWPHAHFLKFDPIARTFADLGRPDPTAADMLNVTVGADAKIYGCTYPDAHLMSYDPATGVDTDLGRMNPTESYAGQCIGSSDGFIYMGIGDQYQALVAYDIGTGKHTELKTAKLSGFPTVYLGVDGKIYAQMAGVDYLMSGGQLTVVSSLPPPMPTNVFSDGSVITVTDRFGNANTITVAKGKVRTVYAYAYQGEPMKVYRINFGPDGNLYGSSYVPAYMFRIGQNPGTLGWLGCGEAYSLLPFGADLLIAAYDCFSSAPLQIFNPLDAFKFGVNPSLVNFPDEEIAWRPRAMIAGPGGMIYLGALPSYGELGGPMVTWNPATGQVAWHRNLIYHESVITLTAENGLVIGGTTIYGSLGSRPTQTQAHIFIWDPSKNKVVYNVAIPAKETTDLVAAPNGLVYGMASQDATGGSDLLVFDPAHPAPPTLYPVAQLGTYDVLYNSLGVEPGSATELVGATQIGIMFVDTASDKVTFVKPPGPITAGFALGTGPAGGVDVYFGVGSKTFEYLYYPSARPKPLLRMQLIPGRPVRPSPKRG